MHIKDRGHCFQFTPGHSVTTPLRAGLIRVVLFTLIWWILTDGAMNSWLVGVPVVLLATSVSMMLLPPCSWSLTGIVRFVPFFLWHSLRAGVDVAWRALHPRLPIAPAMYHHRWRLPPGLPQVFMANTVSLLPGTLSTELGDEFLAIHVLDQTGNFASELMILEEYVAGLYGLHLMTDRSEK